MMKGSENFASPTLAGSGLTSAAEALYPRTSMRLILSISGKNAPRTASNAVIAGNACPQALNSLW